jgi:hypothetical protein
MPSMPQYPIRFSVDGKNYSVPPDTYDRGGPIILPDGRVFKVDGWLESLPPIPTLVQRPNLFEGNVPPGELAESLGGTLATEIQK